MLLRAVSLFSVMRAKKFQRARALRNFQKVMAIYIT